MSIPVTPHKLVLKEDNNPLPGRYTRTRFVATEGTSTDISNIHIPPLRNAYLNCRDAFLTFSVTSTLEGTNLPTATTPSNNLKLDASGACSFICSTFRINFLFKIFDLKFFSKAEKILPKATLLIFYPNNLRSSTFNDLRSSTAGSLSETSVL